MSLINSISFYLTIFSLIFQLDGVYNVAWDRINLPDSQLPFYFNTHPKMKKKCDKDDLCPYKRHLNSTKCYGYEKHCKATSDKLMIGSCPGESRGWVSLRRIFKKL